MCHFRIKFHDFGQVFHGFLSRILLFYMQQPIQLTLCNLKPLFQRKVAAEQGDQESPGLQKSLLVREAGRHVWHRREEHKFSPIRV
jgi:hypothetical protein